MYYLISILLGLIPEVLYFTMFLICTKNIKDKKIRLFLFMSIIYFICMLVQQYQIIYYVLFIGLVYLLLKILYKDKTQIIDTFVISLSSIYLTLLTFICFIFLKEDLSNYYLLYGLDRILLIIPFIFKNKFNIAYKKYCKLWNRNDNIKRPIKSITLRNISLIILNSFIVLLNIAIMNIVSLIK